MNIIAFSLYGNLPRYTAGAVENARMAKEFYPDWEAHYWLGKDVAPGVSEALLFHKAVIHHGSGLPSGMFWRHLAHDLQGVERYIVRDVDSRISLRETNAVRDWIKDGTQLHVMRDHPWHMQVIMGGMWGWWKRAGDFEMLPLLRLWQPDGLYGGDQRFLAETLWKLAASRTIHDSCGTCDGTHNWPSDSPGFAGEYVDERGHHNLEHRRIRQEHLVKIACV